MDFLNHIPTVQRSCCHCSLKTGALIICYLTLVGGFLLIPTGMYRLNVDGVPIIAYTPCISLQETSTILLGLFDVVVSFIGLYGIYQQKSKPILIILAALILDTILYIYCTVVITFDVIRGNHVETAYAIKSYISTAAGIYMLLIMYSYYRRKCQLDVSILSA